MPPPLNQNTVAVPAAIPIVTGLAPSELYEALWADTAALRQRLLCDTRGPAAWIETPEEEAYEEDARLVATPERAALAG